MKKTSGFTLIELLVVIAIIGILSGVVLTSLNSTRGKGRIAVVQQQFSALQKAALTCIDDGQALTNPTSATTGGGNVCAGTAATWPAMPTTGGWTYTLASFASSVANSTFTFVATGDSKTVTCTQNGCTTN